MKLIFIIFILMISGVVLPMDLVKRATALPDNVLADDNIMLVENFFFQANHYLIDESASKSAFDTDGFFHEIVFCDDVKEVATKLGEVSSAQNWQAKKNLLINEFILRDLTVTKTIFKSLADCVYLNSNCGVGPLKSANQYVVSDMLAILIPLKTSIPEEQKHIIAMMNDIGALADFENGEQVIKNIKRDVDQLFERENKRQQFRNLAQVYAAAESFAQDYFVNIAYEKHSLTTGAFKDMQIQHQKKTIALQAAYHDLLQERAKQFIDELPTKKQEYEKNIDDIFPAHWKELEDYRAQCVQLLFPEPKPADQVVELKRFLNGEFLVVNKQVLTIEQAIANLVEVIDKDGVIESVQKCIIDEQGIFNRLQDLCKKTENKVFQSNCVIIGNRIVEFPEPALIEPEDEELDLAEVVIGQGGDADKVPEKPASDSWLDMALAPFVWVASGIGSLWNLFWSLFF